MFLYNEPSRLLIITKCPGSGFWTEATGSVKSETSRASVVQWLNQEVTV